MAKGQTEFVSKSKMRHYRDLVDELCDVESGLSKNEVEFIDTLCDWDGCFTVSQAKYLEKVWEGHLG